jgi:hypothetical protein
MNRLRNALKRPPAEFALFVSTLLLVWVIRVGLWTLPFPVMRKLVAKAARPPVQANGQALDSHSSSRLSVMQLKWSVQAASRCVPQATCLTQALSLQILMVRRGHDADVHIGVAKDEAGKFEAHAWVESEGQILIGGVGARRMTPLTTLEARKS